MQREDVERLATELDRQDEYAPLGHMGWESAAALRALLADLAAARAEIERLTKELEEMTATKDIHQRKRHEYFERAEKAETEIKRLTEERDYKQTVIEKLSNHIEKAEAEHDIDKKLLRSCLKGNNSLREKAQNYKSERDNAYSLLADAYGGGAGGSVIEAHLADAERDMRQRAADLVGQEARTFPDNVAWGVEDVAKAILALPLKHADREGGV